MFYGNMNVPRHLWVPAFAGTTSQDSKKKTGNNECRKSKPN
jgi:hypothetical protein